MLGESDTGPQDRKGLQERHVRGRAAWDKLNSLLVRSSFLWERFMNWRKQMQQNSLKFSPRKAGDERQPRMVAKWVGYTQQITLDPARPGVGTGLVTVTLWGLNYFRTNRGDVAMTFPRP